MKRRGLLSGVVLTMLLLALVPLLLSCPRSGESSYTASFDGPFDTATVLSGYAKDKESFAAFAEEFSDMLWEYHKLYDIYTEYSGINNLKTVNEMAGVEPVKVDRRIIDLLLFCREMYGLTGGTVDITYGSVLSIWHSHRLLGETVPGETLLENAALHSGFDLLLIDEVAETVYLTDPDASLDVGAIAKGYATEQVCLAMREKGYDHFAANVGGNIRTVGGQADGADWGLGVQNPDLAAEDSVVLRLSVRDLSLVTSGSYQRYYVVDGVRYHHIIDPTTHFPGDRWLSVSILCADAGLADALSTALFNLPYDTGLAVLQSAGAAAAVWITVDGEILTSPGIEAYLKEGV